MYKSLLDLSQKARDDYKDMVRKFQQELEAALVPRIKPHRHHLGHYRNLSGCSAISFSSVISEPISEDYPNPEPPVDSRGNEIPYPVNPYGGGGYNPLEKSPENTGGLEDVIDRGGSEAAQTEESGTIENCASNASKASSETIEAKEITEVDNDDVDDDDDFDEDGAELDAIEAALNDEDDGDDEDLTVAAVLKDASLPVDEERVAHWVAETQNCLDKLTIKDEDEDQEEEVEDVKVSPKTSNTDEATNSASGKNVTAEQEAGEKASKQNDGDDAVTKVEIQQT